MPAKINETLYQRYKDIIISSIISIVITIIFGYYFLYVGIRERRPTSRIQGMCNQFNEEVIVSEDLISRVRLAGRFTTALLGSIKLRGKEKELSLSSVRLA